jgi:hypothetical protein
MLLAVVAVGFLFGLFHLFNLRFQTGDNYPPYSSLRSDPLGSKAFYESLDRLLPSRRHLQSITKLGDSREAALFWLGQDSKDLRLSSDEIKELERFLRNGGRIIFGLLPALEQPRINRFQAAAQRKAGGTNTPPLSPGNGLEDKRTALKDRWEFNLEYSGLARGDDKKIVPGVALRQAAAENSGLPPRIKIHSGLHFGTLDPQWRVLYARIDGTNSYPVLVERNIGRGTLVLSADSYYCSNESLRSEREPELLAWFVGPAREVIFDETHLGVKEEPGVATLARKYRLGGSFFALLVLAGLFIWRNTVRFMPPHAEELARERGDLIAGRDSASGFINLLRRNVAPVELMKVCLEQWNAHFAHTRKPSEARLAAMQKIIDAENQLEPNQRNPVATYRKLSEILSKRL